MVRMAGRIAENFIPENQRTDSEQMYSKYRPRADSRINSRASIGSSCRKINLVETDSGLIEVESDKQFIDAFKDANMDAVHHLNASNPITRAFWCTIIILFVILVLIQCSYQISLYLSEPVATNIEAEYPKKIAFPTVAICNNNQFRLTYLTGNCLNRNAPQPTSPLKSLKSMDPANDTVFDTVIRKSWDLDAVRFLRIAAHGKSRMILGCTWPNGKPCYKEDFRAVWTTTGLCWAINTDQHNPFEVSGSGPEHGLKLLLNVESYERVDACNDYFRTTSLPGLKIMIYNQTDIPESSQNGVNVPPGYSMDIPFKMQHRKKLSGNQCIEESDIHKEARGNFNHEHNIRTCSINHYLKKIEEQCDCTLRKKFTTTLLNVKSCNVDEYFSCAQNVIKTMRDEGTSEKCLPPCQSVDYTAWQDMMRLPQNIMPVEYDPNTDENNDVNEDLDEYENEVDEKLKQGNKTSFCEKYDILDAIRAHQIRREATSAYEAQSRHQHDIFIRTKKLIVGINTIIDTIKTKKWGWHPENFQGIPHRLSHIECYANFTNRYENVKEILSLRESSEERRAKQILYLIDEKNYEQESARIKSISDLKAMFGNDKVDKIQEEVIATTKMMDSLWKIFNPEEYMDTVTKDFSKMDKILGWMNQYEKNGLQRKRWAEKMEPRNMKTFFDDEFIQGFYMTVVRDFDMLQEEIDDVTLHWDVVEKYIEDGKIGKIGAITIFGDGKKENRKIFEKLITDMHNCAVNNIQEETKAILDDLKKLFQILKEKYNMLFKEELHNYLKNFDFDSKFENDNFAMVNIYLHKMHLETWSQDRTYGFWSLACDIGGALGLFLGASILTIIEIVYLCIQYGICGKRAKNLKCLPIDALKYKMQELVVCDCCRKQMPTKERIYQKRSQSYQRRFTLSDHLEQNEFRSRTVSGDSKLKKNIWRDSPRRDSMSPTEITKFLDRAKHNSNPPEYEDDYYDQQQNTANIYSRLTEVHDSNPSDDRFEDTSGYHSEDFMKPPPSYPQKSIDIDPETEPISISEMSESNTPKLFQTPDMSRRQKDKQSYV